MSELIPEQSEQLKKSLLTALSESGNITKACRSQAIGRTTYYDWCSSDAIFAKQANDALVLARESRMDLLEDAIMEQALGCEEKNIKANPISQIFALKALSRQSPNRVWSDAPPEIAAPVETNDTPSLTSTNQEAIQEMMSQYILKLKTTDANEPTSDKPNATEAE